MRPSRWRTLGFDKENGTFYFIPTLFIFWTDTKYKLGGIGFNFLFWTVELWTRPIPTPYEPEEEWL